MKTNKISLIALFMSVTGCVGDNGPVIGDNDPAFEIFVNVPIEKIEDGTGGHIIDGGLAMGIAGHSIAFLIDVPNRYHVTSLALTARTDPGTSYYIYAYTYVGNNTLATTTSAVLVRGLSGQLLIDMDVSKPEGELLNSSRIVIARHWSSPIGSAWISGVSLIAQLSE